MTMPYPKIRKPCIKRTLPVSKPGTEISLFDLMKKTKRIHYITNASEVSTPDKTFDTYADAKEYALSRLNTFK